MRSVALLTSGGDAPGMNACIRAVTRTSISHGAEVWGINNGFQGMVDQQMEQLTSRSVAGILQRGGSVLGAGRCLEFIDPRVQIRCVDYLRDAGVEGLIVIGGDGSLRGVHSLNVLGFSVIGVPGSIDNDVPGTDNSIGADTAINTAVEAIDRLRDTASAHHRAMIVEVMGRHSGYIAHMAAIASGAEMVIVPEHPIELQAVFDEMEAMQQHGKRHFIIVLAEGAKWRAAELTQLINDADNPYDARYTVLGYIQRGGSPSALDRTMATQMGVVAVDALLAGKSNVLVAMQDGMVVPIDLSTFSANETKRDQRLKEVFSVTST
jgi:6-phosphofructokinase 1